MFNIEKPALGNKKTHFNMMAKCASNIFIYTNGRRAIIFKTGQTEFENRKATLHQRWKSLKYLLFIKINI